MMEAEFNHLNHATWECKYHVVFTPKYRKKLLFGKIKRHLGQVFHDLARRKECRIEEGHLMPDHVHMLISIPPKYSVAQIIGYMKGKSSIWIAQNVERKMRNFLGHKFWARGYFVTTVGRDEEVIRAYIRNQELADRQLEQFELKILAAQNQTIVQTSLKTAFGGSQSNLQLCWRLLACLPRNTPLPRHGCPVDTLGQPGAQGGRESKAGSKAQDRGIPRFA
jgi:putative transposase